jgi:hypothetical protein
LAPPVLALVLLLGGGVAAAAPEKNKCGCYRNDSNNTCTCSKGAKCGCPGECEPKGCEEKREAQIKKEIAAETKKAADADRKHKATSGAGEMKTASAKAETTKAESSNGEAAAAGGKLKKLSPAQVQQLSRLLDGYLTQHPDARSKNVEELRNQLSLTPR